MIKNNGFVFQIGPLKRHFTNDLGGVIYFVDANDRERFEESAEEMRHELSLGEEGVPLLIFANKMDLPGAVSSSEIMEKFDLRSMNRPWYIQSSCATKGEGLHEGMDWLTKQVEMRRTGVTTSASDSTQ